MGYLDNSSITVDAILTKKGRELLAKGRDNFVMWWNPTGGDVIYTTEAYNGSSWIFISEQRNLPGQILSNYATLGMGWGVARVVAEWSGF